MYLVIIPAFNEEKTIGSIIQKIKRHADQIVVIDDHSSDDTGKIARSYGATVVRHSKNKGVGAVMKTGITYAKKLKPDMVITIDADGQHRPEDIPSLIRPIIEGKADFVLGSRFLAKEPTDMLLQKKIGNKLLSLIVSLLAGVRLTDTQTGFRAINKRALLSLNLVSDFTYTQEMILVLCHNGFRCAEVPVQVNPRKHGKSKVASRISSYAFKALTSICSTYLRLKIHW
jgi:glycosyltransferase involved in cell wall biosynthesis